MWLKVYFAPMELYMAEPVGIWIGVNISVVERNLGFFSNDIYRRSSKNEGISSGPEEKLRSIRCRALKCQQEP